MHQRVDLQLRVFKRVRRRILHLLVDHLSNSSIQADLRGEVTLADAMPVIGFSFMCCCTCVSWISYSLQQPSGLIQQKKSFNCR